MFDSLHLAFLQFHHFVVVNLYFVYINMVAVFFSSERTICALCFFYDFDNLIIVESLLLFYFIWLGFCLMHLMLFMSGCLVSIKIPIKHTELGPIVNAFGVMNFAISNAYLHKITAKNGKHFEQLFSNLLIPKYPILQ